MHMTPDNPVNFDATASEEDVAVELSFEMPAGVEFKVAPETRTITGLAVPYGPIAASGWSRWQFQKGSLKYADLKRVKIFESHNPEKAVGYVAAAVESDAGMTITAKIARGPEGDRVLSLAEDGVLDGFSIGVDFLFDDPSVTGWTYDEERDVKVVYAANWRETSLTPVPAFDGARVAKVKAARSRNSQKEAQMDPKDNETPALAAVDFAQLTEAIKAGNAEVSATFAAALKETVELMRAPQTPEREASPTASGIEVTREAPVYSLDGQGFSFVKDAFKARTEGDTEARDRLLKYERQTQDNAQRAQFAVGTTVNLPELVNPGNRPDLYIGQVPQGRPLVESLSRGALANSTPYTIPTFVAATGMAADHVEGVSAALGDLNLSEITITPKAKSGKFQISRELADASNPAVDAIALAAMREAYIALTEADVATMLQTVLAAAPGNGALLNEVTGGGDDFILGLRAAMAAYPFRRFAAANRLVLSQAGFAAAVNAVDTTGRPLLPVVGPQNAFGTATAGLGAVSVDGVPGLPAWGLSSAVVDAILFNAADVWFWESPLLTFRFEEKVGPEKIELAIFGYTASSVIRPSGIIGVDYTAA